MTHPNDYTLTSKPTEKGLKPVQELLRVLINYEMQARKSKYHQSDQYERTEDRKGHANGYKLKSARIHIGGSPFQYPRYRKVLSTRVL